MQNLRRANRGQELYDNQHYITKNINVDICTSDYSKEVVVVVNKSGQHRFSTQVKGYGSVPMESVQMPQVTFWCVTVKVNLFTC